MEKILKDFIESIKKEEVEVYNEFSLQHELGIYLRKKLPGYKVEFERNIKFFGINEKTVKKEIDIVVYKDGAERKESIAIELKFPRNGQYPEQMYAFIKDICFMEQLKRKGFKRTFCLTLVDDEKFYSKKDNLKTEGIYGYFRKNESISRNTTIEQPTGNKNNCLQLSNDYRISWQRFNQGIYEKWRYYLIEV